MRLATGVPFHMGKQKRPSMSRPTGGEICKMTQATVCQVQKQARWADSQLPHAALGGLLKEDHKKLDAGNLSSAQHLNDFFVQALLSSSNFSVENSECRRDCQMLTAGSCLRQSDLGGYSPTLLWSAPKPAMI